MKKIVFFYLIVVIACNRRAKNSTDTFIVPADTMPVYIKTDHNIFPPPHNRAYYFPSNFIIDTVGQIFYYQQEQTWNNDSKLDWNTPPVFMNLEPKDIVQIPINNIGEFIKLNILNIDSLKRYVAIASTKDTIQSDGLSKIIAIFKDPANHIRWKFRKVTQEEVIVLEYKKRQAYYNSKEIKWDSTNISFRHKH